MVVGVLGTKDVSVFLMSPVGELVVTELVGRLAGVVLLDHLLSSLEESESVGEVVEIEDLATEFSDVLDELELNSADGGHLEGLLDYQK